MANLLQNNSPSIQENLLHSLRAVNDSGHLTYLIKELNERKISSAAEAFTLISLCIYCYPSLINHSSRYHLERLYDFCFLKASPADLLKVLDRPQNTAIKGLLYTYFKDLIEQFKPQSKKKTTPPAKELLDHYVHFVTSTDRFPSQKASPPLVKYLLDDYVRFALEITKAQKAEKTLAKKPLKRS
jgi:hypothetical protein